MSKSVTIINYANKVLPGQHRKGQWPAITALCYRGERIYEQVKV